MNILVINCGSSSVKHQLIDCLQEVTVAEGVTELSANVDAAVAVKQLLQEIQNETIDAVGHRVVHGGDTFRDAVLIDAAVLAKIQEWVPLAPLHNPPALTGIEAAQAVLADVPHVAVFDTAFHATLPRRASHYAIDTTLAEKHRIRRYGFHGTSHQFVALEAARYLGRPLNELRLITLHLGNGASACAVEMGSSTETSMGMTPLEGLVMGSRSGDIDAGVIFKLLRDEVKNVDELDNLLNLRSGIKGLSGLSHDIREIEAAAASGHDGARLSIAVFAHRVKKYIGAYAAAMGGVDAVILTGGIGENSASLRRRILQRLEFLGIQIDEDNNQYAEVDHQNKVALITTENSRVPALVVKTNEELMIARQAACLIGQQASLKTDLSIPIAVSARHLHLDKHTFALLFGDDAEPTHHADLSQPGQFSCKEKVTLVGTRNTIEGVRLLGPLRSKNQIEVSRTDEYLLGIDAPVRDSGRVKDSAPITLKGTQGHRKTEGGVNLCSSTYSYASR
jgi:acetate kinase